MSKGTILVVDDAQNWLEVLTKRLEKEIRDVDVFPFTKSNEAIEFFKTHPVNVLITDMKMEHPTAGYELLTYIKQYAPQTLVIVVTAVGTIENAVLSMRMGCFDYLEKPLNKIGYASTFELIKQALQLSQFSVDRDSLAERIILANWNELLEAKDRKKKGVLLENLCRFIFRTIPGWNRIRSRVKTPTEEIDLVIENESSKEFWKNYGTIILVECKNWYGKRKPGRIEFDAFRSKIERRGIKDCRLGFFVSLNGVTKTFKMELNRIASEEMVIVPLSADDLWQLICTDDRSEFMREKVTEQILS